MNSPFPNGSNYALCLFFITFFTATILSCNEDLDIVDEPSIILVNKAPVAVASANVLLGNAPLTVNFTGDLSTDDEAIISYQWDFSGFSSSVTNPQYTFQNPGTYKVTFTVTDKEGLTNTTILEIVVNREVVGETECNTNGGFSGDEGLKQWCWSDLEQEINSVGPLSSFSNSQLAKSVHYNTDGTFVQNGRLNFKLDPISPLSSNGFNYRQEIRDSPSDISHPIGTEQWWGFDYKFGADYIADELPWIMWQTHGDFSSPANPMTTLQISPTNFRNRGGARGELMVVNNSFGVLANGKIGTYIPTGVIPVAGQTIKVVIHLIWGDETNGLYRVWLDAVLVYDEQQRTVYAEKPEGGYWKIGIYKWRWREESNINISADLGISRLNTSIGTLRVLKKSPSNSTYLSDEYDAVRPK